MFLAIAMVLATVLNSRGAAPPPPASESQKLFAVVDIVNNTGEYTAFAAGMPDMLITELLQSGDIRLLERTKIQTAMKALKLEASGLTDESNLRLGKWLGADGLIVGAFNKLNGKFRLDIRVIDVSTGTISFAVSSVKEPAKLLDIIPDVGRRLWSRICPEDSVLECGRASAVEAVPNDAGAEASCRLRIEYRMIVGLFMQQPVPFQKVRVYIDGKLVHTSQIIDRLNDYFTLFEGQVEAGVHNITLIHGTVRDDGTWRRNLGRQPEKFQGRFLEGEMVVLRYKMRASDRMNKFTEVKAVY